MLNNKMPDGSFAVDSEQFEIVRDTKAPYIPVVKSKGGSSELPEVTSEDNGKVLGVVDGEWDKTEAGGGSGAMVVTFTMDEEENITADKTYDEMSEAMQNKTPIFGYLSFEEENTAFQNMSYVDGAFYFTVVEPPIWSGSESNYMNMIAIMVYEDEIILGRGRIPFGKE